MTDTSPSADATPDFNEAAELADIQNYSPDRARGGTSAPRVVSSGRPIAFTLDQLSPDQRGDIPQRLARINNPVERQRAEAALVEEAMRSLANASNIRRGHPNGNLHDREVAAINVEVQDMETEALRIGNELAEVVRHDTVTDPTTGLPKAVPVYRHHGTSRARLEDRQREIARNVLELMVGPGGKYRLGVAAEAELEVRRVAHNEQMILNRVHTRAIQIVTDDRVEELARARAKGLRGNL